MFCDCGHNLRTQLLPSVKYNNMTLILALSTSVCHLWFMKKSHTFSEVDFSKWVYTTMWLLSHKDVAIRSWSVATLDTNESVKSVGEAAQPTEGMPPPLLLHTPELESSIAAASPITNEWLITSLLDILPYSTVILTCLLGAIPWGTIFLSLLLKG